MNRTRRLSKRFPDTLDGKIAAICVEMYDKSKGYSTSGLKPDDAQKLIEVLKGKGR